MIHGVAISRLSQRRATTATSSIPPSAMAAVRPGLRVSGATRSAQVARRVRVRSAATAGLPKALRDLPQPLAAGLEADIGCGRRNRALYCIVYGLLSRVLLERRRVGIRDTAEV